MRILAIVIAAAAVLGSVLIFLVLGGTEMLRAKKDVAGRGYNAEIDVELANGVRARLPKGFVVRPGVLYQDGDVVEIQADLGSYASLNQTEWAARLWVSLGPPGSVRVVAKPDVYTAEQCDAIERGVLASLRVAPGAREAFLAERQRAKEEGERKRIEAVRWLSKKVGVDNLAPGSIASANGVILLLGDTGNFAQMMVKLSEGPATAAKSMRLDEVSARRAVQQAHVPDAVYVSSNDDGKLRWFKLHPSVDAMEEETKLDTLAPAILEQTPIGQAIVWRRAQTALLSDVGVEWLMAWWADAERMRGDAKLSKGQ